MPPSEPPEGVFVTWALLQWTIAVFAGIISAICAFIWRIGVKLGGYKAEFDMTKADMHDRREKLEKKLDALENNDRELERAVAALPDVIMTRINGSFENNFRYLNNRIDELMSRLRSN